MSDKKYKHYSEEENDNSYGHYDEEPIPIPAPYRKRDCSEVKCDAQDQGSFCIPLSFDQELGTGPTGGLVPVSTFAQNEDGIRGVLKLKFNSSLSRAAYGVYVFNASNPLNKITAAHLHIGGASINGPVVVDLFLGPPRNVNGLLVKGLIDNSSITNRVIENLPAINSVASLYQAIREGALYANVHSQMFPDGVARGQIYLKNSYAASQL